MPGEGPTTRGSKDAREDGAGGDAAQPAPGQRRPSRRLVLGAAGVGVASLATGAVAGLAASPALASSGQTAAQAGRPGTRPSAASGERGGADTAVPIVIHLRDARTGVLDVFHGDAHTRLRDPGLARRLIRGIR